MIPDSDATLCALQTPMAPLSPSRPEPMAGTPAIIRSALAQYARLAARAAAAQQATAHIEDTQVL